MNSKTNHGVVACFARLGLAFACLLVALLVGSPVASAQSTPRQQLDLSPRLAAPSTTDTKLAPPFVTQAAKTPETSAEKPPVKEPESGIRIHGHWTIEVRNSNGSVEKHVEFENGICPTQPFNSFLGPAVSPGGALFLSLLSTNQISAGPWLIALGNSSALNSTPGVPSGCARAETPFYSGGSGSTLIQKIGIWTNLAPGAPGGAFTLCGNGCFQMDSPNTSGGSFPSIIISGQIPAATSQGGTIALVSTGNILCNGGGIPLATCAGAYPLTSNPYYIAIITGTQLTGTNGTPPPVTYIAGQSVVVSVVLSFS